MTTIRNGNSAISVDKRDVARDRPAVIRDEMPKSLGCNRTDCLRARNGYSPQAMHQIVYCRALCKPVLRRFGLQNRLRGVHVAEELAHLRF